MTFILGGCSNTPVPGVINDAAIHDTTVADTAINDATADVAINDGIVWPDGSGPVLDGTGPVPDGIGPMPDGIGPVPDGTGPVPDSIGPVPDVSLPTDLGFKKCGPWPGGNCPKSYVCNIHSCAPGASGSCVLMPIGCPKIYKPVCGCDNKTYDNDCFRLRAQVALQYTGTCNISPPLDGGSPDGPIQFKCGGPTHTQCTLSNQFCDKDYCAPNAFGTCTNVPAACPMYYSPVCGCDNKTYGNDCFRKSAKVSLQYTGKCKVTPTPDAGVADAGTTKKCGGPKNIPCMALNQFCDKENCSKSAYGTCEEIPAVCPMYYAPVCGCNNMTYGNDCFRKHAQVSLAYKGKC